MIPESVFLSALEQRSPASILGYFGALLYFVQVSIGHISLYAEVRRFIFRYIESIGTFGTSKFSIQYETSKISTTCVQTTQQNFSMRYDISIISKNVQHTRYIVNVRYDIQR